MTPNRLLSGPPGHAGAEAFEAHVTRLGPLPAKDGGGLIRTLEASELLGRGGGMFPVGRKWRSVSERAAGRAVVVANGAEGEPFSAKDRTLMALRPHLVMDGALLAADAVGADEVILYVGIEHGPAQAALARAVGDRDRELTVPVRLVAAPTGYVSGEASAAVHYLSAGDARPTTAPPPYERGVRGLPTLVQNVESLAQAALIARFGDEWYRTAGRGPTRGTALVTASGAVAHPGVMEIEYGTPLAEVAARAGASRDRVQAVLLGGYFGGWTSADDAWDQPLDPARMQERGSSFGCGLISLLEVGDCGVVETARIMAYMAESSVEQCGPCVFGLQAIANAVHRLATLTASDPELERIERWSHQLTGRGACHHPDGAVGLLQSGLASFADEFALHAHRRCSRSGAAQLAGRASVSRMPSLAGAA
jgi:NADH:ubiquinone oxidoreductase subunit F (NADH-binding)